VNCGRGSGQQLGWPVLPEDGVDLAEAPGHVQGGALGQPRLERAPERTWPRRMSRFQQAPRQGRQSPRVD
jgi:hypothetical protein